MSKSTGMNIPEPASQVGVLTMPLDAVRFKDLPRVGGKAAHLGELLAAGLPVPTGFVVTTDAYERFMRSDPRIACWLQIIEKCDAQDPVALRAVADELKQHLRLVPVPDDVADAIAAAMEPEPGNARAVRSSATAEDLPEASFAGQHDSFLNVCGGDAVVATVKRCWLSLFSERAISYRMRRGIALSRAQMAVIVQQLIDADAAGVMFTAGPADGDSDSIFIEAAFGLGEAVVQGQVTPDRIEVSRSELRVARRDTALKRVQIVAAENGVCERQLAAEKATAPALNDAMATRLARLGLEVERVSGGPLDIEWSVRNGEIWLLQARAVTTLRSGWKSSFENRQVWTNANAGEVMPDVVTPMTYSVLMPVLHELLQWLLLSRGVRVSEEQIVGLIAGRVYFNFNTACALGRCIPGLGKRTLQDFLGGRQDVMLALGKIQISAADLPQIEVRRWQMATGLSSLVLNFLFYPARRGETAAEAVRCANDDFARIEPRTLSDDELLRTIRTSFVPEALRNANALAAFAFGFADTFLLFELCQRWFGAAGQSTANRLLAGVGELDTAAAGYELWRLAELAAREPKIKNILLAERTFLALASRLEACQDGRDFLSRWNAFMHRHGHHARGEIELFNPRWSECPDFVLDTVRSYVEAIHARHPSPILRQDALADERVALQNKCIGKLGNPLKRAVFRFFLYRAQKGGRFRENIKSEAIRTFAILRRFLLELGRRLAARGRLAEPNDIFFLEIEKLPSGSLWDQVADLRALVSERRALYEQNLKITPPAVIIGRFDPDNFQPEAVDWGAKVFHGLGVSAGTVTGRARVILRSDTDERVQPGEILVAPFTDPGWTPYFVAAAGIVMDMGGLLSHGSIIAREYGIPAVVNVGPATQIIRTGQWLEVDADRGVVKVLDAAAAGVSIK
ncbi:MAG TPA: PEP/pyruvate-binding domain-containing protein [Verrucomicrobiae bacterium]|nr:PEP/pyruvate-binding domain-containing protein [Verrucomicrobiae bacterium]